jgi:hypothetical protein
VYRVGRNLVLYHSGYLTAVLREIRRLGPGFSQVDSVFLKKKSAGCEGVSTVDAPGSVFFEESRVDLGNLDPKRRIWRGSVTISKT